MDANIQTTIKPFIVTIDGEIDPQLSILPPARTPLTALTGKVAQLRNHTRRQAEMALYDAIHGTHYRRIHNKLQRDIRNQAFEKRIGLERIGSK